ncbi:hypothetical protein DFJ73DRAFT_136087 [Zopfochytrium polystomum]|nr:hypothetical protein DFJ73DRAFT_136087 [Zopfochytrium polystomum]
MAYKEDGTLDYDNLCRIPDPTNLTLVQLASLYRARVTSSNNLHPYDKLAIKQHILSCFFKHAMRYFNESDDSLMRGYLEGWTETQLTTSMRVGILGDELKTLFTPDTVLYFKTNSNNWSLSKVTFHREIQSYVTGKGLFVYARSNNSELNYSVQEVPASAGQPSKTHSCVLLGRGSMIAVLDQCWEPSLFLDEVMTDMDGIIGVTEGPLSNLVVDRLAELSALTAELSALTEAFALEDARLSPVDVLPSSANTGGGSSNVASSDQVQGNPGSRRRGLFGLFRRAQK